MAAQLFSAKRFVLGVLLGGVAGATITTLLDLAGWSLEAGLAIGMPLGLIVGYWILGIPLFGPVLDRTASVPKLAQGRPQGRR
jgi:hypothetical protein